MVAQPTLTSQALKQPRLRPGGADATGAGALPLPGIARIETEQQFAQVYAQTVDAVFRYASVFSADADEAEDLVGETYLRAWTRRRTYQRNGPVLAWLLSITHNLAVSRARRHATASQGNERLARGLHATPSAETHAAQSQETAKLFQAIRQLPEAQQQVVALRFLAGRSHPEVAAALGKGEDAIRALQYRALKQIRRTLGDTGATG